MDFLLLPAFSGSVLGLFAIVPLDLNFTNLESKLRNGKNQEEASDCAGDDNGKKKKHGKQIVFFWFNFVL